MSLLGPMTIGGRVGSSRCNIEEFNFGKTISNQMGLNTVIANIVNRGILTG